MGLFLSLLDATVVATMLVDISQEFQDFKTTSWVVLAYTLTEVGTSTRKSQQTHVHFFLLPQRKGYSLQDMTKR